VRRRFTLALCAAAGAVLVGCSSIPEGAIDAQALECPPGEEGCDEIRPIGDGGAVTIEMGNFFFEIVEGFPVTGDIDVTAVNVSDAYHNIEFLGAAEGSTFLGGGDGRAVAGADGSETDEGVAALFPGEWTFICNVPGHRAAGMEATLVVYATAEEAAAAEERAAEGGADDEMQEQQQEGQG
jgi:plastocyanin